MERNYEAIKCKVAIYSENNEILVTEIQNNEGFGLPGGYIEKGEEPIEACIREVGEEVGVEFLKDDVTLKNAWRHQNGAIILGYVAKIPKNTPLKIGDPRELAALRWVTIDDIANGTIPVGVYRDFILKNQVK